MLGSRFPKKTIGRTNGFALILTLSLLSFVFLLVITLVNQVRLEFSFTDARQNQILARAHARMGMMIAIGEIQKHLGPDMRVSATADIYDERLENASDYLAQRYPQAVSSNKSVDLDEDQSVDTMPLGQRMWTGVWRHRGQGSENYLGLEGIDKLATRDLPYNSDKGNAITKSWSVDTSYDHHPAIEQAWLVSGNEGWTQKLSITNSIGKVEDFIEVPDGIYIDDEGIRMIPGSPGGNYGKETNAWLDHQRVVRENLSGYYHPLVALPDPDNNDSYAWLLKKPVTKNDGTYAAEPVKAPKTTVSFNNQDGSGRYAYWVGDEGVKTKINIMEPFQEEQGGSITHSLAYPNKLMIATQPNLQAGSYGLNFNLATKKLRKDLVAAQSVLELMEQTATSPLTGMNPLYHSLTTDSFGLLADVRTGGLRRDLSLAFIAEKGGDLWKSDFKNNWIFRDRAQCEKNFPMYLTQSKKHFETSKITNAIHKNQWFDEENDATVQDFGALLAGPQWSVLADYHNLAGSSSLSVSPPSQFPRMVGDNALIFKAGESPSSPGEVFPRAANKDALKFFNCFKDRFENSVRPEPENHSISPVLTKVKFGMFPAIADDTTNEIGYALIPHVSLWNPYDKPMELSNLYMYLPLFPVGINVMEFDLREYDLFRKWWMYTGGDQKDIASQGRQSFRTKVMDRPWPLFAYSLYDGSEKSQGVAEFGPMKALRVNDGPYDKGPSMNLQSRRQMVDGQSKTVYIYAHENPRAGTGEFVFTGWSEKSFQLGDMYFKIENTVLSPGQSASFNVRSFQQADFQTGTIPQITLSKGREEEAFFLKTGIMNFTFGSVDQTMRGVRGLGNNSSDDFIVQGSEFSHSPASSFFKPCVTLYKWEGGGDPFDAKDQIRAKKLSTITKYMADTFGRDDQMVMQTRGTLRQNWKDRRIKGKLPGFGWQMETLMPADQRNERVSLVEFNMRHLIHSTQHGMGYFIHSPNQEVHKLTPSHQSNFTDDEAHLPFIQGRDTLSVTHPKWPNDDEDDFPFTNNFEIPDIDNLTTGGGEGHVAQQDAGFPDLYQWPGWPNGNFPDDPNVWNALEVAFNQKNNTSDMNARASALGFSMGPDSGLLAASDYPDNLLRYSNWQSRDIFYAPIPIWDDEKNSIGFFLNSDSVLSGQTILQAEKSAVLFEIPKAKPLSLMQYRHANLNSYLHGPSYALGNAYASTQVARHRPWGRMQSIVHQPTSDFGLRNVKEMMDLHDRYVSSYVGYELPSGKKISSTDSAFDEFGLHDWGADAPEAQLKLVAAKYKSMPGVSLGNGSPTIGHHIDRNEGFAPWRKNDSGTQLDHQNTTIDHSYYLNRALLDGFFLSGVADHKKPAGKDTQIPGQRYRPFLYDEGSGQKKGNHRLVAYHRNGDWNETSYHSLSSESNHATSSDEAFRYQSLAGDLLVDGAFNINSTSVDAWVAQLSSLRGEEVKKANGTSAGVNSNQTPIIRFLEEPDNNNTWNEFRKLSDDEIADLAKSMVKQVKLRGPFLSFSDFVNRRLAPGPEDPDKGAGSRVNFVTHELATWSQKFPETRDSVTGLRGAVQAAIADAGLNDPGGSWPAAGLIPKAPSTRLTGSIFNVSPFGLHASSIQKSLSPKAGSSRNWGGGTGPPNPHPPNVEYNGQNIAFRFDKYTYDATNYGEAPENLLAVEHLASAANKPGWVMQGDLLSPLAPVSSARSDTFIIRVMGETAAKSSARAWIEVVVQRTPDYVKSDLDAPHHRPHEPFRDENFNGYWDNGYDEEWLDLNRNGNVKDYPDLPGESESRFRDGMISDLRLNLDPQEDDPSSDLGISIQGINQRFGRKFKIVRFRWIREQDV